MAAGTARRGGGGHPAHWQWAALRILSLAFALVLQRLHLSAAWLLGPMAAAILLAAAGATVRVPQALFFVAQGVVGCLIARSIPLAIIAAMGRDWPLLVGGVLSVIAASSCLGLLLTRWQVLPGTTAVWGSSPGAATAMTLMAEAYGADVRLVALMLYLRVVCVVVTASLVASLWTGSFGTAPAVVWFPPLAWGPLLATTLLVGFGVFAGQRLRVPAGPLLLPMALGILLQDAAGLTIELPPLLLAASYVAIGWSIGPRFTRPILIHAARALPRLLAAIFALIAICGGLAAILVTVTGVDPLTAYLATSPGGADSVAIIAASGAPVDVPFVMAMQTTRFLVVLLTGPALARFIAGRVGVPEGAAGP